MSRTIYADTPRGRLGAAVATDNPDMVSVWVADGPMLGLFKLDRFDGATLTAATLRGLFTPQEKRTCVGCFADMPGEHRRGCPTGQNGSPDYS